MRAYSEGLLRRYLGVPYNYEGDPERTKFMTLPELRIKGMNCQTLVQRVYKDLGFPIPTFLLAAEMFEENRRGG